MIVAVLERHAPPQGFGSILDVGCGDGLFFPELRRFGDPRGVETDADLVSEESRSRIWIGAFDDTFDPAERYGLILMLDVVEHLDDDVAALRQAARLLVPGGLLVITVPAFRLLWTAHDDFNHHRTRYRRDGLVGAVEGAGLEVRSARYFFHWLFPLKLAVRCKERLLPRPPEIAKVPAPLSNRIFYGVSRLEQASWGHLPWPFGSSLLAVCRRPR